MMISEIIDAFKEIQDGVISMIIINEKLYICGKPEFIDFSPYFEKFTQSFFRIIGL